MKKWIVICIIAVFTCGIALSQDQTAPAPAKKELKGSAQKKIQKSSKSLKAKKNKTISKKKSMTPPPPPQAPKLTPPPPPGAPSGTPPPPPQLKESKKIEKKKADAMKEKVTKEEKK